jgi:hypothetical protein
MRKRSRRGAFTKWLGWSLAAAAIAKELRKPPGERSWHGRVAGFVPYDFRMPTVERMRASWWNPDDERIFTDQVFGVGWAVNVGRVVRLIKD